jgi:hypothetical protein
METFFLMIFFLWKLALFQMYFEEYKLNMVKIVVFAFILDHELCLFLAYIFFTGIIQLLYYKGNAKQCP